MWLGNTEVISRELQVGEMGGSMEVGGFFLGGEWWGRISDEVIWTLRFWFSFDAITMA